MTKSQAATKEHFEKPKRKAKAKAKVATVKLATVGHNSDPVVIPDVVEKVGEYLASWERQRTEAKLQRDIKAELKQKYGISSAVFSHEIRLRKMDSDVRIQFESNHHDLKLALGYQAELDLKPGTIARTEEEYADPSNRATAETLEREG